MPAREEPAVEELLRRAAAGDADAAGRAVQAHDDRLRRVVRLRLDPRVARRADVDDVLQETHLEAFQRLREFLAARAVPFVIWLRALAVQRCVTLARRHLAAEVRDARRERPLAGPVPADATSMALEEALSAHVTTPSRAAARTETRASLRAAIQTLDPFDREIVCLRNFEALDNAEAAAVLGISPAAASKRFLRALVRLRDALAAVGLDAPTANPY
jgi:RNA polymerase sigma-70 factor (ECF subfamily)